MTSGQIIHAHLGSEVVATAICLLMETQRLKDTIDFAVVGNDPAFADADEIPMYQQIVCDIIDKATDAVTELREFMERRSDEHWRIDPAA